MSTYKLSNNQHIIENIIYLNPIQYSFSLLTNFKRK